MPDPQNQNRIARFGAFELNFKAGELRKSGARLRLQEQPFQVLALLLERAGDVVTREELRQKLWPSDTFVDFDHSLNTAINKVREVLGDSASSPRYVETLARRGYRFIAPVQANVPAESTHASTQLSGDDFGSTAAASEPKSRQSVGAFFSDSVVHPELEVPIPHRGLTRALFALVQVMYLAFYLSALFRLHAMWGIADSALPSWGAILIVAAVIITSGIGIPLRCYLISAVGFDHQRLGEKFRLMFPFILALDQLWATAPFLLIEKIGVGAAFAACAGLLYVPFSERTLVRMAYIKPRGGD